MKFLVITENYPRNNGEYAQAYIRPRNLFYKENGIDVDILSFSAKEDYEIDNMNVYSYASFKMNCSDLSQYDLLISHAPNIKHHFLFIKRYGDKFKKIAFFFHGHEVLKSNKVYPKQYPFVKRNYMMEIVENIYDDIKFLLWKECFKKIYNKSYFIFVSNWMFEQFKHWIKLPEIYLKGRTSITYNSVGKIFEENSYDLNSAKKYDFVTIRGNLDWSKYAVDIVNELAKRNPCMKFLIVGKGKFFEHYEKADNVDWSNKHLSHEEMLEILNSAKCALMPTRTDAQGVMMCEMATFGIPVITSNIPVCREVFDGFENVQFINNENKDVNLSEMISLFGVLTQKPQKYLYTSTCGEELAILKNFIESNEPVEC